MAVSMFPLQGWVFLFTHKPSLLSSVYLPLIVLGLISFGSFIGSCFTIQPLSNAIIAVNLPSWLALIIAVFFALIVPELIVMFTMALVFGREQQRLAHKVLENFHITEPPPANPDNEQFEHPYSHAFRWLMLRMLVFVLSFPVNIIPAVGQVCYFYINGALYTWQLQEDYLRLKGFQTWSQQLNYVTSRVFEYGAFGSIAIILEVFCPGFNAMCMFANAAGANIWAAKLHSRDNIAPIEQEWNVMPDDDDDL